MASGFVLVFDYMLSDLSEVIRNSERPLSEVSHSHTSTHPHTLSHTHTHTHTHTHSHRLRSRAT